MVVALHHVQMAIPPGGEHDALRFYGDLLGLKRIDKPPSLAKRGGAWFGTATLQVHLGIDPDFTPAKKAHVAFEVEDLRSFRARRETAGLTIADDEPLEGFERFYVSDPFGNRVELLSRLPGTDPTSEG